MRRTPARAATYDPDCTRCPRLAGFLEVVRRRHPDYWARPVPSFGAARPRILIVGLAPGLHGANRTGRPFTGDHAGLLLYDTLYQAGLATRPHSQAADDPLRLIDARIVNTVKCVPPQNKPLPAEVRTCNGYLAAELQQLRTVRVYLALGRVAHEGLLLALGVRRSAHPFGHGREHALDATHWLIDSYHCSRYNTATRRLTAAMFRAVVARACERAALPRRPRRAGAAAR
ncbi:MAG: uracil-DNA glycosylase [Gammaproteobacteria bacterium]|nr:uracil-DNA glycosylase [Gammaproteobacteria bacterium]MBV8404528.1 uracil-DNA glycosylase [Gammaproteobacteria bacterium]